MGGPTERPTSQKLKPPSSSHMAELGNASSSPSQVVRGYSPGCSLIATHPAELLLDTWPSDTV